MSICMINEPCVTQVMQLIETSPEPFILEPEPDLICTGKLCEIVSSAGPVQGPFLEDLVGREELLAFMFNNDFPPIVTLVHDPVVIPLPAAGWLLIGAIVLLGVIRRKNLAT